MKAALKEEQGKSQSMGMVVKYLENAKEALEKEKQALIQKKSTEVSFSIGITLKCINYPTKVHQARQEMSLQVKELTEKLADAESKKATVEATLALRERQSSEVVNLSSWQHLPFLCLQLKQHNICLSGEKSGSKEVGG